MSKYLLTLLFIFPTILANYDFPVANFTMNFLNSIGMERVTEEYTSCHVNFNESLYSALYLPDNFKRSGVDGILGAIAVILSDLYDINRTCQASVKDITQVFGKYIMSFGHGSYLLGMLRNVLDKSHIWFDYTSKLRSCIYYKWWGCAGSMSGLTANTILNVTPLARTIENVHVELNDVLEFDLTTPINMLRDIFDTAINFLIYSNILSVGNATKECIGHSEAFYREFTIALEMFSKKDKKALEQLLYSFRPLKPMHPQCNSVIKDSVKKVNDYLNVITNFSELLNRVVFRCKLLVIKAKVIVNLFRNSDYGNFGIQLGHFIKILLDD